MSLEGKANSRVKRADFIGNGHWQFCEFMEPDIYEGFIYFIRNLNTDKAYIGKKAYKSRSKVKKGQETNWPWYISSCDALADEIKYTSKDNFEFIVIEQYKTKGGLSFAESWSLMHVEVPYYKDKWYNTLIDKVSWSSKEPISDRHRDRLRRLVSGEELTEDYEWLIS